MASIRKDIVLDARPDDVWDALRDFHAVHERLAPGFVVSSQADGDDARVVVRGIGPSLDTVSNRLPDPMIELHDGNGQLLAMNDDWKANETEVRATGLAPNDDHESALVADLLPGNYTLVLRGKNNTSGVGLVEIYNLP